MQIPPIIPESTGSAAPAQRKEGAAINGLIQLVTGMPTLPRADPRLATIVVPPTLQLSEATITAERDRRLLVESKTLERAGRSEGAGAGSSAFPAKLTDGGLALDLGVWLKQLSRQSSGPIKWPAVKIDAPIEEPTGSLSRPVTITAPNGSSLPSRGDEARLLMSALVQGLALSNLFAARNLAGWVTGERLRNSSDGSQARTEADSFVAMPEMPAEENALVSGVPRKLVEQWMKGIESDSSDALEAAQLLLNGKLIWQGQLADGTPMLMQRYDVWREPKKQREPMERGVGISIETELKSRGRLKIEGRQWRDTLEIIVTGNDPSRPPNSWHGWQALIERLHERAGARVISRVTDASGAAVDVG